MPIPVRTRDAILLNLRNQITSLKSNMNTADHSVAYDISLYPASVLGEELWLLADFVSRSRSLSGIIEMVNDSVYKQKIQVLFDYDSVTEVETLISGLLGALVANWNVVRKGATAARGPVRFYSTTNTPLTIANGALVASKGQNPVNFTVKGGTLNATPQYDSTMGMYYVETIVEATASGATGNVGTGAIAVLTDAIANISLCKNPIPTYGGADAESDVDLATRAQNAWTAWTLDTYGGMESFFEVQPIVKDAYVSGPGDPLMRRNRQGASLDVFVEVPPDPLPAIDVFVTTEAIPAQATEPLVMASAFAQNNILMDGMSYTGNTASLNLIAPPVATPPAQLTYPPSTASTFRYYFNNQPVVSVQSVSGTVSGNFTYRLNSDVSATYSGSTRARSYIDITASGVTSTGETITISYTYDAAIVGLQNTINAPENNLISQDVLVRAGAPVYVNVTGSVVSIDEASYPVSGLQATIEADLLMLFNGGTASTDKVYSSYGLGQRVDRSDLLFVALSVDGVDRIDRWTTEAYSVQFPSNFTPQNSEYARLGSVTWL